jgi:photosystem II stability/assembly factor-like uncharacterized protein
LTKTTGISNGGWQWQNPTPQGNTLTSVSCIANSFCFAVGENGTILASSDSGVSWVKQFSNTNFDLRSISCLDAITCSAIGSNGGEGIILFTNNSGTSWTVRYTSTNTLNDIHCKGINCFAVGYFGLILFSNDKGENWQLQNSNTIESLQAISCAESTNCYVVGYNNIFLQTTNQGSVWNSSTLPFVTINGGFSITCPTTGSCFVVFGNSATVLATTNSGANWNFQSGRVDRISQVSCGSSSVCYAIGNDINGNGSIAATNDGGLTWLNLRNGPMNNFSRGSCFDNQRCVVVGYKGLIFSTD